MTEEEKNIELAIKQLEYDRDTLRRERAKNIMPQKDYEIKLRELEQDRNLVKEELKKLNDILTQKTHNLYNFKRKREEELDNMFKYGDREIKNYERSGYTFRNVEVVNGWLVPEHSKNINLFFHWIHDRRGEWMKKRKEWKMNELRQAITSVEQDYEYDSRGR